MTRASVREYAAALRARYVAADRREKGAILDEFCRVTGYRRKPAIRLLGHGPGVAHRRGGRPKTAPPVVAALRRAWEAADRPCGKRLAPFLDELVASLERHAELRLDDAVRERLLGLSAATIDRALRPYRGLGRRQPLSPARAVSAIAAQVAVRTFGEWAAVAPGACQADLVLHCGATGEGFFLTTLVLVDVATGWVELEPVWGHGQQRVGGALHRVRGRLPVPLRELHTDNGGEFLNGVVFPYCQRHGVRLTRGRPYKKNDQAWVEQRNWTAVRRVVGYGRFTSRAAFDALAAVYAPLRLYLNFFHPLRKLVAKERVGARVRKRYDRARTPYRRLLAAGVLRPAEEGRLAAEYAALNPVALLAELDAALATLATLAEPDRGLRGAQALPAILPLAR
jgi:hypothetical protein